MRRGLVITAFSLLSLVVLAPTFTSAEHREFVFPDISGLHYINRDSECLIAWSRYDLPSSAATLQNVTSERDARRRVQRFELAGGDSPGMAVVIPTQIWVPRGTRKVFVNGQAIVRDRDLRRAEQCSSFYVRIRAREWMN